MYQALTNHNAKQSKTNHFSLPLSKRGWLYPSKIIFFLCFGAFFCLFVCFFSLVNLISSSIFSRSAVCAWQISSLPDLESYS